MGVAIMHVLLLPHGMLLWLVMAEDLRKQVSSIYTSLLSAVDKLEKSVGESSSRSTLTSPESSRPSSSTATDEFRSLFNYNTGSLLCKRKNKGKIPGSKKKKLKTWTHTFVCLSDPAQTEPPSTKLRTELQLAGLGERRFSLFLYGGADEIHDELLQQYPKLAKAGGYELLRLNEDREMNVIPVPSEGYTVEYLKGIVHAARIYIRPLQQSLEISPSQSKVMATINSVILYHKNVISELKGSTEWILDFSSYCCSSHSSVQRLILATSARPK